MKDLILIAQNSNGFVIRSLETSLIIKGVSCLVLPFRDIPTDEDFKESTLIFILGSDELEQNLYMLQTIKSKCIEHERRVVCFGLTEENEFLKKQLGDSVLIHEFLRPMPPLELADKVKKVCEREKKRHTTHKVLVVDNSGMTLRTMMEWLEGDYIVQVANSAMKATPMIEKDTPDIILLDYEMPECSGADFFMILKNNPKTKDIPVIFLTSKDDIAIVKQVLELKPAGYVLKTTPRETLIERIEEVLSN